MNTEILNVLETDLLSVEELKKEIFLKDTSENHPLISTFLQFVFNKKGKNLRTQLTLHSAKVFGNTNRSTYLSAILIDILHEATLLHDDVVDAAELRRGQPSANMVFGNKATVLMGDYLLSKMIEVCTNEDEFELLKIISTTLVSLSKGELLQLNATKENENSVEQLLKVALYKTGSLLKASCISGAISVGVETETKSVMENYAENLGIAYQIKDDIIDYINEDKELYKDIKEGKINIPLALALENVEKLEADKIVSLVKETANFKENIVVINDFIKNNSGIEKAEKLQDDYINKAISCLETVSNTNDLILFTQKIGARNY